MFKGSFAATDGMTESVQSLVGGIKDLNTKAGMGGFIVWRAVKWPQVSFFITLGVSIC